MIPLPSLHSGFLSLALALISLPASSSHAAANVNVCKHLSPQKMLLCQQKIQVDVKKVDKKSKPSAKPLITPVDILMFLL